MFTVKIGQKKHSLSVFFKRYALAVLLANIARMLFLILPHKKNERICLVGHRLNGNLKAFYDYMSESYDIEVLFFTDDPNYYRIRKGTGEEIYSLQNLLHLKKMAGAQAICTSHGPLSLSFWQRSKRRPVFIEVWHGAGFKNRKKDATSKWLFYDGVFVSSPAFKQFHKGWGYKARQLFVTGYAQTDTLVRKPTKHDVEKIRKSFGLSNTGNKIVLYAPTWNTKDNNVVSPYSTPIEDFFASMNTWAKKNNVELLVLPHINSTAQISSRFENINIVSSTGELDIKPLLHIVDVLITDWSSIYTDFLALPEFKPVVFLDTPPTFYGFTLTPEDRAGTLTSNQTELFKALSEAIKNPQSYVQQYSSKLTHARKKVWGGTLDGKSAERYYKTIQEIIHDRNK